MSTEPQKIVRKPVQQVTQELRDAIAAQNEKAAVSSGVELLGIMTEQVGLMAEGLGRLVDAVQKLATANVKTDGKPN